MTPDLFAEIGAALYGPEWRQPLARELGVIPLSVKRWITGENLVPVGVVADLRRLLEERLAGASAALAALDEGEEGRYGKG